MSAPMACCIDILSSGYTQVSLDPVDAKRTYRQHSRLSRERTCKESAFFINLRELVERYQLETTAVLYSG